MICPYCPFQNSFDRIATIKCLINESQSRFDWLGFLFSSFLPHGAIQRLATLERDALSSGWILVILALVFRHLHRRRHYERALSPFLRLPLSILVMKDLQGTTAPSTPLLSFINALYPSTTLILASLNSPCLFKPPTAPCTPKPPGAFIFSRTFASLGGARTTS